MSHKEEWGTIQGQKCYLITLKNKSGMSASFTNYGAALVSLFAPDKDGNFADVVLGYDNLEGYIKGNSCHGATIGRFANRIGGGRFELNGKTYKLHKNDGDNCLHGGRVGYNKQIWDIFEISDDDNSSGYNPFVTFGYTSPDGEEKFPGEINITVCYTLTENSLLIKYSSLSNQDTILNLTNHTYFNLSGFDNLTSLDTKLQILAERYTPVNMAKVPNGTIAGVKGTVFDFTVPKLIGEDINSGRIDNYDNNYILREAGIWASRIAAIAVHEASGRIMTTHTDMPAIQLYSAKHLNEAGKNGVHYGSYAGFCLETQFTPDTPNLPMSMNLPSCVLKKGEVFKSFTEYAFSVKPNTR